MTRSFLDLPVLKHSPAWALSSEDERRFVRADDRPGGPQSLAELSPYLEYANDVTEFSKHAQTLGLDNVLVGIGRAWIGDESGFCYRADEFPELRPDSIVVINPDHMPAHVTLVDLFLHEVAHIYTNGDEHSWTFLVMLNVMRLRCGLGPSLDSYDWRDVSQSAQLAKLSLADPTIQNSGADVGRLLSPMPYEVGHLRFLIQEIWGEVELEIVAANINIDFAELCRRTAQSALAKWMMAAQSVERD